jgi:hypothetical protein
MALILYANNAAGTLSAGITNVSTTLTLNAGQGALFPAPVNPQVFYVTLTDVATQTLIEIVKVTAVAGDVFSITRAQDGTSALSWNAGDIVSQRTIRLELQGFENAAEGDFASQNVSVKPSQTLGIVGTTTNNNANAGSVGEYLTITASGALVNNVTGNVTALTLTAGDWDVSGAVAFNVPAASTLVGVNAGVSIVSATLPGASLYQQLNGISATAGQQVTAVAVEQRLSLAATTQVFLVGTDSYTSGGPGTVTGTLHARRVR